MTFATSTLHISVESLRVRLAYDAVTGEFRWLIGPAAGRRAGTTRKDGRCQISIDKRFYLAARLAWLHVTGAEPSGDIDHADRNKANDAFSNLRDCSRGQNMANRAKWRGTSKFLGVNRKRSKWESAVCSRGVKTRLGTFDTEEEAARAYNAAAAAIHGEFAVLQVV